MGGLPILGALGERASGERPKRDGGIASAAIIPWGLALGLASAMSGIRGGISRTSAMGWIGVGVAIGGGAASGRCGWLEGI